MDSELNPLQDDALASSDVFGHLHADEVDDDYYRRPRAKSEATTDMSKGRLNAAWASFKRSREVKRLNGGVDSLDCSQDDKVRAVEDPVAALKSIHPPNVAGATADDGSDTASLVRTASRPRKVVSLLFRRKRRVPISDGTGYLGDEEQSEENDLGDSGDSLLSAERETSSISKRARFRRVRSQLNPPVANAAAYAAYAAELDDNCFDRLREFTKEIVTQQRLGTSGSSSIGNRGRPGDASAMQPVVSSVPIDEDNDAIIGEICLEDFADASSEDFDFLDDPNADYTSSELSLRVLRRPSLKMDNQKLTWIGNESEFQAFFADFGLDNILLDVDSPEYDLTDFALSPDILAEWDDAARCHNDVCSDWLKPFTDPPDIRLFVDEFSRLRTSNDSQP
jgi:hypothetical protein